MRDKQTEKRTSKIFRGAPGPHPRATLKRCHKTAAQVELAQSNRRREFLWRSDK
jgi:hypothetical protein